MLEILVSMLLEAYFYKSVYLDLESKDSVTLLGEFLEKNGKETPLCSII